jgi:hypothetical protein
LAFSLSFDRGRLLAEAIMTRASKSMFSWFVLLSLWLVIGGEGQSPSSNGVKSHVRGHSIKERGQTSHHEGRW